MCSLEGEGAPAPEGLDQVLERVLLDLRRAPPLAQAAALSVAVLMLGSIATDLRNARRSAEAELVELRRRIAALEGAAGAAAILNLMTG
jgi:hypothetical protein